MSIRFNRRATGKWLICPWCFILPRPPQGQFLSPETIARAFQAAAPIPPGARPLPATAAPGKGPSLRASLHGVSPREARSSLSSRRGSLCRRGASAAPPSRWLRLQDGDSTISLRDFPAGRWVPDGHVFSHFSRMNLSFGKAMKWWQKGLQPNMRAIQTAQDLVDSLTNAGDGLVVIDFFSPGCAGCHALHPKICQFAERNPDVQFLQVNYEEHKSMCYSLHVHVFPFFRFYRGAQGRLCSFSCTNATIKKLRDALEKHRAERCSVGPTRGLEESELLALAANKDLQFTYTKELELAPSMEDVAEVIAADRPRLPTATTPLARQGSEDRALVSSGR